MSSDNETRYRKLIAEGFNGGDMDVIADLLSPDFVEHEEGSQGVGPAVLQQVVRDMRTAFPDLRFEIADLAAVGDKVWSRIEAKGTNTGPIMGQPATGRPMSMSFMDVSRFADGRLVEHWGIPDHLAMLTQLGLFSLPDPA